MPKWNVISKQTRETVGSLEAESQSEARRQLVQQRGDTAKYYEISLADRENGVPPEDLELSPSQLAEVIQRWAIQEKGFPEGTKVSLLTNGSYLSRAELMLLTFVAAKVQAPKVDRPVPEEDDLEDEADTEVEPAGLGSQTGT